MGGSHNGGLRAWGARYVPLLLALAVALGAALVLVTGAGAASPCTDTYTPSSGTSGDWSTAANWSTGVLPTSTDVACWADGVTVTVDNGDQTADSIQGGTLQIAGGDLTLGNSADASTLSGDLDIDGGSLSGDSPITVSGNFDWQDGQLGGSGTSAVSITQTGSGTFSIDGSGTPDFTGGSIQTGSAVSITNASFKASGSPTPTLSTTGTVTFATGTYDQGSGVDLAITAAGYVTTGDTALPDYSLEVTGNTSSLQGGLSLPSLTVDQGATLTVAGGATVTASSGTVSGTVNGAGTFAVQTGTAEFKSGASLSVGEVSVESGTLQVDSGATVTASNGTVFGTVDGAGTFVVSSGLTEVDSGGTLSVNNVSLQGGTLQVDSGGSYAVGSGSGQGTDVAGGTLALNSSSPGASTGDLTISSGTLQGSGKLTVSGAVLWTGGQIGGSLAITQTGGGSFSIDGSGTPDFTGGSISTGSAISITNTAFVSSGSPTLTTTATVTFGSGTFAAGAGVNLTISAAGYDTSGPTVLRNYSLVLTGGSSNLNANLTTPSLTVDSGASLTVPSSVTLSTSGGLVQGTGRIGGSGTLAVTSGLTEVQSGGTLSINNVSVQGGTLQVDSGGSYGVGSGSGQGTDVAGGTLALNSGNPGASTGDLTVGSGTLQGSGSGKLAVSGAVLWTGGQIGGSLAITQTGGGSFSISGTGQPDFTGGSITTGSAVSITNTAFVSSGSPTLTTTGAVTFGEGTYGQSGGVADSLTIVANSYNVSAGTTSLPDVNLTQNGGYTVISPGQTLAPGGTFVLESGTLALDGTLSSGINLSSGSLIGTGTVLGVVDNNGGLVAPGLPNPGTMTVSGYQQASAGILEIVDDGPGTGGMNFSQLVDNGSLSLGGLLELSPSSTYAGASLPQDTIAAITFPTTASGHFAQVTSNSTLQDQESVSASVAGNAVDVIVGPAQPPVISIPPDVSGTAAVGETLSAGTGVWTNNATSYTYVWDVCADAGGTVCSGLPGATASTYTIQPDDVNDYLTVVVTAHNLSSQASISQQASNTIGPITATPLTPGGSTSSGGSTNTGGSTGSGGSSSSGGSSGSTGTSTPVSPAAVTAPTDMTAPSISGTPLPGDKLTCGSGQWTGAPAFTYAWRLNGRLIAGQRAAKLTVSILDEGGSISCSVTASNSAGARTLPSSSRIVAHAGTLTCPRPTGVASAAGIGPLRLGAAETAAQRRHLTALGASAENLCLYGGWDVRAGYIDDRLAVLVTANPFYRIHSVSAGDTLAAAKRNLKLRKLTVIGKTTWYEATAGADSNFVLAADHGLVQGVGVASVTATASRALTAQFLRVP